MFRPSLERGSKAQNIAVLASSRRDDIGKRGLAAGDRPGFVEDYRIELLRGLQRIARADENAVLSALADADRERGRRGKSECTRAGDDQCGDKARWSHR